jgi:hypothetical protein
MFAIHAAARMADARLTAFLSNIVLRGKRRMRILREQTAGRPIADFRTNCVNRTPFIGPADLYIL